MTPEYKAACKTALEETDFSTLSDVILTLINKEEFIRYRNMVRNEYLEKTSFFNEGNLPPVPVAMWAD
tara:strand:+ start:1635 stop:1838 length:204 start_codon:yes stop_codon:yes gene_type:complete